MDIDNTSYDSEDDDDAEYAQPEMCAMKSDRNNKENENDKDEDEDDDEIVFNYHRAV